MSPIFYIFFYSKSEKFWRERSKWWGEYKPSIFWTLIKQVKIFCVRGQSLKPSWAPTRCVSLLLSIPYQLGLLISQRFNWLRKMNPTMGKYFETKKKPKFVEFYLRRTKCTFSRKRFIHHGTKLVISVRFSVLGSNDI